MEEETTFFGLMDGMNEHLKNKRLGKDTIGSKPELFAMAAILTSQAEKFDEAKDFVPRKGESLGLSREAAINYNVSADRNISIVMERINVFNNNMRASKGSRI